MTSISASKVNAILKKVDKISKKVDKKQLTSKKVDKKQSTSKKVDKYFVDKIKKWYNSLSKEDKDTIEYYVDSSYPMMYYLYVKKDKKLQEVFKSLFKKAYVLEKSLTVYRGISVKSKGDIIPKMDYPFSVSTVEKDAKSYIDKCCVVEIILPKGTKILTFTSSNLYSELIVQPGTLNKTSDLKYTFIPKELSFKNVVLPKQLIDTAVGFLGPLCVMPYLKKYNRTITKEQFQTYFSRNYEKLARDNCVKGSVQFKPFRGYDKPYGLLFIDKDGNLKSYLRGLEIKTLDKNGFPDSIKYRYYLYGLTENNIHELIDEYRADSPIVIQIDYYGEPFFEISAPYKKYKKYFIMGVEAGTKISDGVMILEASGNLTPKPSKALFKKGKDYIPIKAPVGGSLTHSLSN